MSTMTPSRPRRLTGRVLGVGMTTLALGSMMLAPAAADARGKKDRGPQRGPKITATAAAAASQDAIDDFFDDEATTTSMTCKKKTRTRAQCSARVTADGELYLVRTLAKSFYNDDDEREYDAKVTRARELGEAPAEEPAPAPTETAPATPTQPATPTAPAAAGWGNNQSVVVIVGGMRF